MAGSKPAPIGVRKLTFVDNSQVIPGATMGSTMAAPVHTIEFYPWLRAFHVKHKDGKEGYIPEGRVMLWEALPVVEPIE